jgi:uncharacterized protein YndB with AHSA1/START domain
MSEQLVIHSTFVIERSYPKPVERVFAAFANPELKRRWFGEGLGHDVEQFDMDFRVGGTEDLRYRFKEGTPFPGVALINEGKYLEIVPNRCIVTSLAMTIGEKRVSVALLTIEFLPTDSGTAMTCTHQGAYFEGSGGPEMREQGWKTLFDKLAKELAA